jgi:glycosyltransferase involved in cell wall biosynthesis
VKIAITHDYLRDYRGGERVLEALHETWPDAPIYTSIYDPGKMQDQGWDPSSKQVRLSFMQSFWYPLQHKLPRFYFTIFFPIAFMAFNFKGYDVVISSASFAAKYIRKKKAIHISYIHTPPRFIWGYDTDINLSQMSFLEQIPARVARSALKWFDLNRARGVDYFIANSKTVQRRIRDTYAAESKVIYPPVETAKFSGKSEDKGYFLVVSALGEYKKVDLVVEAFNNLGLPLKVVGDGSQLEALRSLALPNVEMLGRLPEPETIELILGCKAFIFPTEEDFGIAPVEAMAAGKPVLAYGRGGATETVIAGKTGEFFLEQSVAGIMAAMKFFDPSRYRAEDCRRRAREFDKKVFKRKIKVFVGRVYKRKN